MFFGAFLGPIFAVLLFNTFIFITIIMTLIKHKRNKTGQVRDKSHDKSNIRLFLSLIGIMFLFGLTWVFAAFTVRGASVVFQIIFAVCNSFQGFFIFLFFCALSRDVHQLWMQFIFRDKYSLNLTSTSHSGKGFATGLRQDPYMQSSNTKMSSLPSHSSYHSGSHSSSSSLFEHPTSTVVGNEFATIHEEEDEDVFTDQTMPVSDYRDGVKMQRNPRVAANKYADYNVEKVDITFGTEHVEL